MENETDYAIIYKKYSTALLASNVLTLVGAAVGIIGNIIIIGFYHFRIKDKSERYFIPALAAVDFSACIINAYGNTVLNDNMFNFTEHFHCQVIWFLELFISGFSGHMVLIIALQRYLLICKPFGPHMTLRRKRAALLVTFLLTVLYASPSWAMSGIKTEKRVYMSKNITTTMCVFVVDYTSSAIAYSGILLFLTVANAIVCISLYLPIIRVIHRSFSTHKTCSTIVPFCGAFEDSGFENENSVSSAYRGKQQIFMNDILRELQTDDAQCTLGVSRTDLISLDDERCECGIQNALSVQTDGEILKDEDTSDKANVSVIEIKNDSGTVNRENENERISIYSDTNGISEMCDSLDNETQTSTMGDPNQKRTSETKLTETNTTLTVTSKDNETDSNIGAEGIAKRIRENSEYHDGTISDKSNDYQKTFSISTSRETRASPLKVGVRLFRTSSKLERMKATMNIMFMTIIIVYVISYIPSLVILILRYSKPDFDYLDFSETEYFVWFFFSRFVFINHIINPFIYGYFDVKLKREFVRSVRCCLRNNNEMK
ncbi:uncharacterized protein [Magallana gigas]|uniref:uncharacterized protein n=1 Tax=Magallana gigas TaxID=29159 RepID=UPI003342A05A